MKIFSSFFKLKFGTLLVYLAAFMAYGFEFAILGLPLLFLALVDTITGSEGNSILGSQNLALGPCEVYWGNFSPPNLTGTVSTTSGANTLTGVGTLFTTELKPGQWIKIVGVPELLQIKVITSPTAATVQSLVSATVAGALFKRIRAMYLGKFDKLVLKYGVKKTDLVTAQDGDNPANKANSGYMCDVEFGAAQNTLARLEHTIPSFKLSRDLVTGLIKGFGFGSAVGCDTDLDIAGQLKLIRMKCGAESTDALDTITVLKSAPTVEAELTYDAKTQRFQKNMFTGYVDNATLLDGVPMIFVGGDIT